MRIKRVRSATACPPEQELLSNERRAGCSIRRECEVIQMPRSIGQLDLNGGISRTVGHAGQTRQFNER